MPPGFEAKSIGYMLLFLACFTCSYVDRQVISLLVEPLKRDLGISDLQIGLLQGFAFAICYAGMGIPIARALDRGNRVRIATVCVAVWTVATGGCGLISSYSGLLATRAATAIAEAGLPPAALSLASDIYPPRRLPQASAIFMLGPYLGTGIALIGGGALLRVFDRSGGLDMFGLTLAPWRAVFLVIAAPGVLLAILLPLLLRDPRGGGSAVAPAGAGDLTAAVRGNAAFLSLYLLGITCAVFTLFAQTAWLPTFFIRLRHLTAARAGQLIGPIYLVAGIAGSVAAGAFAGRESDQPLRRTLALMTGAALLLGFAAAGVTLVGNTAALCLFALSVAAGSFIVALVPVPLQLVAPRAVRAQLISIGAFALAVGSAGGGPFLVGLLTEKVFVDPNAIGLSLASSCSIFPLVGAFFLYRARQTLES